MAIISRVKEFLRQFWNSLLLKIVLVILLFTVVMLIMQTATPVRTTRDMIFAYKHSMLLSKAETIASSLNNNLVLSGEGAQEVVSVLGSSDVGQIVITDAEGIVLFNSGGNSPAAETYALFPEIVSALKGNDAFRCIYNGNAFLSYGAIPIMVGNVITGCVYVADEDQEQAEILNQIQQNAFRMAIVAVLVSLFLVVVCGMKVEGVALGTLIAQWSGFLLALGLCWKYYGKTIKRYRLTPDLSQRGEGRENLSVFFRVNRDIFLRTLCLASVMLFFTSAGSRSGDVILAVNTLLMQFYLLFSYVMDGFAFAGEALSGKRKGAGNYVALHRIVRRLFRWGAALTVAFTLLYVLCGQLFVSLLTDDVQVRAASADYLPWAVAVPAFGVMAFLWDGVFIGMTLTRGMLVSSFVATLLFFALYVLLFPILGNHGLWIAFMVYLLMRGVIQTFWFRYVSKE